MKRPLLLAIGIAVVNGIVATAWSDQCAWITESQAREAASQVRPGDRVRRFCEPCGATEPSEPMTVESVLARPEETGRLWELVINGAGVDLAYLFVESRDEPGRFDNLAKLAGCPVRGVSRSVWPR